MQRNSEFMDRLFTLVMTGGYGLAMTWMYLAYQFGWSRGERNLIMLVAPWIQFMVFLGGVLLLALFFVLLFNFRRASHAHHVHGDVDEDEPSPAVAAGQEGTHHDHEAQESCGGDHQHDHSHHEHEKGHDCCQHDHNHSHGEGHECCDHGHSHGWNPARYIPLLIPLILFMMGLPSDQMIRNFERYLTEKALKGQASFNSKGEEFAPVANWLAFTPMAGGLTTSLGSALQLASEEIDADVPGVKPVVTDLADLDRIVLSPAAMDEYQRYRKVEIEGMFSLEGSGPMTVFRIVRLRMACCLNDSRPASILCATRKKVDPKLLEKGSPSDSKWCKAQGKLKFAPGPDGKYQAFLKASSVVSAPLPAFPYLN